MPWRWCDVTVPFDAEAGDGLAGLGDAVDDAAGPAIFDADHDDGRHVGVGAGADQGAEVQVKVGAELQAAVWMREGNRALDVVGNRFAGGVGQVIERQEDDVIAHADAAVLAAPADEREVAISLTLFAFGHGAHHFFVLRLWTCTCSPFFASAVTTPMSTPYLMTVSPFFRLVSATLWPIGMSCLGVALGGGVVLGYDTEHVRAGGEIFDNNDADVVVVVCTRKWGIFDTWRHRLVEGVRFSAGAAFQWPCDGSHLSAQTSSE